jgi:leader peptidase (prepilin peptidase)/N-methyltransferase
LLIYFGVCTAILGLIFGSFLNCTAMRIVRGEDFVKGRSHCMSCGHELSASDLVPVFSYLFHKGRCRYCGAKVSIRYPITELTFMILSLGLYVAVLGFGIGAGTEGEAIGTGIFYGTGFTAARILTFFEYLFLTGCLFVASISDLESFEIPDGTLIAAAVSWIVFTVIELVTGVHDIKWAIHHILAGLLIGGAMLLISIIMDKVLKRDSMGGGDIKFYTLLGLYLGYAGSYELVLLSCILGLVFAGVRKSLDKGASKEFPFGPAIAVSGYLLLIFGETITSWYLGLFM